MDQINRERKAKWEEPILEEFPPEEQENSAEEVEFERKHGCAPNHQGCRPNQDGCYPGQHGGCRPGMCLPRKGCYPFMGIYFGTYCRPYGFNYGYGCYPRR